MTDATAAMQPRSFLWRLYVIGWAALAGVAGTYLAVAGTRPGFVDAVTGEAAKNRARAEKIERQQAAKQLASLRSTVSKLKSELVQAKKRADDAEGRAAANALPPVLASAPREAAPSPPVSIVKVKPQRLESRDTVAAKPPRTTTLASAKANAGAKPAPIAIAAAAKGKLPPLPARVPLARPQNKIFQPDGKAVAATVLNGSRTGRIVTGSVPTAVPKVMKPAVSPTAVARAAAPRTKPAAKPVITFGAPKVTVWQPAGAGVAPPANASAVVVSAASSVAALRASWAQLSARHPALLGTLQPRYDLMGIDGPYRLLAGPLSDRVEADRLCSALRIHSVKCGVGEFVGNAL